MRDLRDLEFLADVTRETLATLNTGALLWRVVTMLRQRFGYDLVTIATVDRDRLVYRAATGRVLQTDFHETSPETAISVEFGAGLIGTVAETKQPQVVSQLESSEANGPLLLITPVQSALIFPVLFGDELLAVLDVRSTEAAAFSDTDRHLLEIITRMISPALHTARLYDKDRRRIHALRLVNEISRLVMSSLERTQVVHQACEAILSAMDVSLVAVWLLDRSGQFVIYGGHASRVPFVNEPDITRFRRSRREGIVGQVIVTGEPVVTNDVSREPSYVEIGAGVRSQATVPLRVLGKTLGALSIEHTQLHHFATDDLAIIEDIAGYLAQAIDNARLFDSQRRRWQQLLLINEVTRISTESADLDSILSLVTTEVHQRFGYFAAAVMLLEDQELVLRALVCESTPCVQLGDRYDMRLGLAGKTVATGQVKQADAASELFDSTRFHSDVQSVLCVPLYSSNQTIGVLQVQSCDVAAFDEDDRIVLETLAKSVSGAIAHAWASRHNEQLREDLSRMIVHDLRNPVQAVLLTLQEALHHADLLPSQVGDSLREGIISAEDILHMISSLLDVARFESGKAQLRKQPAALNDHVRAVVRRLAPIGRPKGVQVTTILSQELPVLRLDHDLVTRMLTNLISNAFKFTPNGGSITIRTEVTGDGVVLSVADTGEGIPAEYHNLIFEKFGQVTTRKAGLQMSTGLGLAFCRYVIQAHGGQIWVESKVNEGAVFYLTFPIVSG